ncbi:ABC transporter ATP-binding protein [Chelatococcus asaccharovorans]|uniref:Carbohydrate ABC transporter ATP-binding protein (CUT1 family) n=1 Tax=Chelatococcus asaccharovorans TaxID=28210 RepID=A0A2V3TWB3_9HYPH|nr:sn-glycerol-3-phosphate ABC transporter ATP-binding protein UgpC [Chelatococcus asaccharovorans]MBS7702118.1 sn-glycerol-3-phosphate ABC transporter ATP-binding protein UgpC [Chelatococcus asaccharovorans]PXW52887.1 carbohydrate ABC transporter ATP-binding protein (CUT1 family) [Chelatococcus asaccharovorans]
MATVEFVKLVKRYGAIEVVHAIDLAINDGEFIVLVGPSGCGKSTSLRMLAGLEDISAGEIRIDGRVVNEVEPRDRDIAMVFQDYALYPHMSVYENMAFSLQYRKVPKREIDKRVREAASVLGLDPYLNRRPKQLSGGQRQRVAMGRAIVRKPQVFLFDEPLSNLDAKLRGSMRIEMKKLHQRLGVTTVYVTHDQVEAMTLADRVVVMNGGHIEQIGTPDEVYHAPASLFVAGFIGAPTMNLIPARVEAGGLKLDGTEAAVPLNADLDEGARVVFGLRPEDVEVVEEGTPPPGFVDLAAVVEVVEPLGADTLVFTSLGTHAVASRVRPEVRPAPGETVKLRCNLSRMHLFDADTGRAIGAPHTRADKGLAGGAARGVVHA